MVAKAETALDHCAFSEQDLAQIRKQGKDPYQVAEEVSLLRRGAAPLRLIRPCSVADGILRLDSAGRTAAVERFEREAPRRSVTKFVAASGSASRMFEGLTGVAGQGSPAHAALAVFQRRLREFAFFPLLRDALQQQGHNVEDLQNRGQWQAIVEGLLGERGLGYRALPKGLIPFHSYHEGARTALEEHLVEASLYIAPPSPVRVHFTVDAKHRDIVEAHLAQATERFNRTGGRFSVNVSVQAQSTHTVSLENNGRILRDTEGRLVFWPSGHGSLLSNLDSLEGDVVFVRTVDNVLPDAFKPLVCFHKKVMGGVLLAIERQVHDRLEGLLRGPRVQFLEDTASFVGTQLCRPLPADWRKRSEQEQRRSLFQILNRPLRVCAVIPNDGKPGGSPFWVQNRIGARQLRIVEPPEVDIKSHEQHRIWNSAEYFNPADMACSVRDFRGKPFDLLAHQDSESWMRATRLKAGRSVVNLERPGLWNGGMAKWNTVFLDAPRAACRPVKTVIDLLEFPKLA